MGAHTTKVWAWGRNSYGELGTGDKNPALLPLKLTKLSQNIVQLVSSGFTTCALEDSGQALCWGADFTGSVGNSPGVTGTKDLTAVVLSPTPVANLPKNIVRLSAGRSHICALGSDGSTYCWGSNDWGGIGDKSKVHRHSAINITKNVGSGVIQIAASHLSTCVLYDTGTAKCWGSNYKERLGVGVFDDYFYEPKKILNLDIGIDELIVGSHHSCAKMKDLSIKCWGVNSNGRLGNGTEQDITLPVEFYNKTDNVDQISLGPTGGCLIKSGIAKCWGSNSYGQLGDGSKNRALSPVPVVGLASNPIQVIMEENHSCALFEDHTVQCWGVNSDGQLGNGSKNESLTATPVLFPQS